jgi:hypothetical protein
MKYNVGDKVRVKSNLKPNRLYGGEMFVYNMLSLKGQIVTIVNVLPDAQTYRIKNSWYSVTDDMLEEVIE